jgi:hypoxanthine phosphoribosyltransferase
MKTLISKSKLKKRVTELGKEISKVYQNQEVLLICILKGSFIFASDIFREIESNVKIDFLEISSYGAEKISSGKVVLKKDISLEIQNKNVLIVEDIIDTGLSLNSIYKLLEQKKPASIKICTLLLKEKKHKVSYPIQFVGFKIEDEFVVGYGMDYGEKYRNLKYIGILQES